MARALARRGHQVTIACYAHGLGTPDSEYAVVRTPRVPKYGRLRAGPDWVKPFLDLALAARIAAIPADIVHAHNYEGALAALVARRLTGVPVVYNAHNTMGEELPEYFKHRISRRLAAKLGCLLDKNVPRRADLALGLTESAARTLTGLGCRQVRWVAPGVDFAELENVKPTVLDGGPWVVYAGNPDAYQDLDVLVAAMRQIPEAGLLLVSASDMSHWANLGLPRLRTVLTTDFERVKSLIAGAALAALPRAVCSGYPIKLLNYLGLGVPTVAALGSAQRLPGVVPVPNGDPYAMAAAIRELLEDEPRRRVLGGRARDHVRQFCGWETRAEAIEQVYATVLGGEIIQHVGDSGYRMERSGRYTAHHGF